MLGPSFAPGATATTGVTKPASRVPSGWRSSTSTGYTPVRRSCKRVDSRASSAWSGKVSVRLPSSSAGKGSSASSAEHRAQVPAFERGLEAGPRAHGLVRRGAHDEAGRSRRRPRTWRRRGRLPPTVTQAGWPVSTRRRPAWYRPSWTAGLRRRRQAAHRARGRQRTSTRRPRRLKASARARTARPGAGGSRTTRRATTRPCCRAAY